MNSGHVKDDVNEVAIFLLMHFAFRANFLSKRSPLPPPKKKKGQWIACIDVFIVCAHPYTIPDHNI